MNDCCRYDRHNQSTLCATLSLPLAAAGCCPGSFQARQRAARTFRTPFFLGRRRIVRGSV